MAQRQDRAAFARLFDHFAPRGKGYIRRLQASDQKAEDMVQEVMITVWRRAALYDGAQASVGSWIFTIARNDEPCVCLVVTGGPLRLTGRLGRMLYRCLRA